MQMRAMVTASWVVTVIACGGLATEGSGGGQDASNDGSPDDAVGQDGTGGAFGSGGGSGVGGSGGAGGSVNEDGSDNTMTIGCGGPSTVCHCPAGSNCDMTCSWHRSDSHCIFHCPAGSTCTNTCPGGFCVFYCSAGSTCVNSCPFQGSPDIMGGIMGGNCEFHCPTGATCTNTCGRGGGCRTFR